MAKPRTLVPQEPGALPVELGADEASAELSESLMLDSDADPEPSPVTDEPAPAASGELPDASTIDVAKLTKSILTNQGWLVPSTKPD